MKKKNRYVAIVNRLVIEIINISSKYYNPTKKKIKQVLCIITGNFSEMNESYILVTEKYKMFIDTFLSTFHFYLCVFRVA